ncbi:hypothetical protein IAU60_006429 [Kwoniella sp. DSM 27419]
MLLSALRLCLFAPVYAAVAGAHRGQHSGSELGDSFHESLTLRPLPDGRLSVLFEFGTAFSADHTADHPLLLPLRQNNVSELTISFASGWDPLRTSSSGPSGYDVAGGGGEVRGWLRESTQDRTAEERWGAVTHALGGLFCAGLGPSDKGENIRTFGQVYPPARGTAHKSQLCTENLTPFLSLLPSKGQSGLSALLAKPGIIFAWASQAEGIEVIMPDETSQGRWRGWWEGIVDVHSGGRRDFTLEQVFKRKIPRAFPEASSSWIRLILEDGARVEPAGETSRQWIDGKVSKVIQYDLTGMSGEDIRVWWEEEKFISPDLLETLSYHPSKPPRVSTTTLHFTLTIPPVSTLILTIPFSKLTLKYDEHQPDAERGVELASGVLTLLDTVGEGNSSVSHGTDPLRSARRHIYTNRVLLDVPTPDFSMPYNVIIMSSTVMAVFFGLMQGSLTRKWGWVQVGDGAKA